MTVDEVYRLVSYIVAKNISQGYISPDDFNLTINAAERKYLDYLLGEYQKYTPTRPFSPVAFANNQRVRTSMAPLIYGAVLVIDSAGVAPYPSDFEQVDAMWGLYGLYRIRFTQQDQLFSKYRSVIDPVQTNPIYAMKQEGFQFYPETLGNARMSYVRTPPYMKWGYQVDSNDIPVYDPSISTQPIWSDTDIFQIIVRALQDIGVSLQYGDVVQYGQAIKTQGQ